MLGVLCCIAVVCVVLGGVLLMQRRSIVGLFIALNSITSLLVIALTGLALLYKEFSYLDIAIIYLLCSVAVAFFVLLHQNSKYRSARYFNAETYTKQTQILKDEKTSLHNRYNNMRSKRENGGVSYIEQRDGYKKQQM